MTENYPIKPDNKLKDLTSSSYTHDVAIMTSMNGFMGARVVLNSQYNLVVTSLCNSYGLITGLSGIATDISEHKITKMARRIAVAFVHGISIGCYNPVGSGSAQMAW